jgi:4-hydroxybenzoate polyprenyltransferase
MVIEFILGAFLPSEVMQWLYLNAIFLSLIILLFASGLLLIRRGLLGQWRFRYDSIIYLIACLICFTSMFQTILGIQVGHPWLELADTNPILMNLLWIFVLAPKNPIIIALLGVVFLLLAWLNSKFSFSPATAFEYMKSSCSQVKEPVRWWQILGGVTRVSVWLGSILFLILSFLILGGPPLSPPPNIPLYYPNTWMWFLVGLVSLSLLNSAAFMINQLGDVDTDQLHSEKAQLPISSGRISRRTVGFLAAAFIIGGLLLAVFVGFLFLGLVFFIFVFAVIYSFPPLRLKGRPLFDLAIIGLAFGSWAVLTAWAILVNWLFIGVIPQIPLVLLFGAGVFYAGTHGLHTASDYAADKQAGVKTTAVFLGPKKASNLGILLIAFGMLLFYVSVGYYTHLFWYGLIKYKSIFLLIFCGFLFFALFQQYRLGLTAQEDKGATFDWLQKNGRKVTYVFFLVLVIYMLLYVFLFYPVYYPSYSFPWG